MINILAIDPSISSTGLCFNGDFSSVKTKPEEHRFHRVDQVISAIERIINDNKVDYVAIEQYAFNSRDTSSLTGLAELGGCIKYTLFKRNINPIIVSATRWKAMLFNECHAEKNLILKEVYKRFNKDCKNSDEADAFSIYKFVDLVLGYLSKPDTLKLLYHETIVQSMAFDLVKIAGMLDAIKVSDKRGVTDYYYKNKKVSSFKGLLRQEKQEKIYSAALKQFVDTFKIK